MLCPPLTLRQPLSGTLSILIRGPPQKDSNLSMNLLWVAQGCHSQSHPTLLCLYSAVCSGWTNHVIIDLWDLHPVAAHVVPVYQENNDILNVSFFVVFFVCLPTEETDSRVLLPSAVPSSTRPTIPLSRCRWWIHTSTPQWVWPWTGSSTTFTGQTPETSPSLLPLWTPPRGACSSAPI